MTTCSNARGDSAGRVRFQGAKKRLSKGKELNALVANLVKEVLATSKILKTMDSIESGSEEYQEHFNFETHKNGEGLQTSRTLPY